MIWHPHEVNYLAFDLFAPDVLEKCMSFSSRILPFRGLLYNTRVVREISECVCPPYDVIEDQGKYYEKSLYNAVRVELPLDSDGSDRYETAKDTLRRWLSSGVLYEDQKESIYVFEQSFFLDGKGYRRLGFLALLKLDMDMIFTHEKTKKAPKEDREKLLRATKTFTSFVFGLYVDEKKEIEELLEKSKKELLYEFVDEGEIESIFFRMADEKEVKRLKELMENKSVYIADGHHRLEVARRLGLSYMPIYLTDMFGSGIRILPYHRLIKFAEPEKDSRAWQILSESIKPSSLSASPENFSFIREKLFSSQALSFAVIRKEDPEYVYLFEQEKGIYICTGETSFEQLKIQIIHDLIIRDLLKIEETEINFTPWFERALEAVKKGICDLAFLCPPVSIGEVKKIAEMKMNMPPKSTYFFPKIPTGPIFFRYG